MALPEQLDGFKEGPHAKLFPTTHFGYRKITVERLLRLNFQATPERIARLENESAFRNLARSKKRGEPGEKEMAEGRALQESVRNLLGTLPNTVYKNRNEFTKVLGSTVKTAGLKLSAPLMKAILNALSEQDETAEICRDKKGNLDAWIDTSKTDAKDGDVAGS